MYYFDCFDRINTTEKEDILKYCRESEEAVITYPGLANLNARRALECLCRSVLKDRGTFGNDELENMKLEDMIEICKRTRAFSYRAKELAHNIRKKTNKRVHPNIQDDIENAMNVVNDMYDLLAETFRIRAARFDRTRIRIGKYEIVRHILKSFYEQCEEKLGKYNYIVKNDHGDYYYMKGYLKNDETRPLSKRNNETNALIRQSRIRSLYLTPTDVVDTSVDSDRYFIAYSIYKESFVLGENRKNFTLAQSTDIVLDVINAILDMNKIGLNYRNLNPFNVIITPYEDSYQAMIINMEGVRNKNAEQTVYGELKQFYKENVFIPQEIRNIPVEDYDSNDIPWDKVYTYSCAALFIYCAYPSVITGDVIDVVNISTELPVGEPLTNFLINTFGSSLELVEPPEKLKEILEAMRKDLQKDA